MANCTLYCSGCFREIKGYQPGAPYDDITRHSFFFVCDECKKKENGGAEDIREDSLEDLPEDINEDFPLRVKHK